MADEMGLGKTVSILCRTRLQFCLTVIATMHYPYVDFIEAVPRSGETYYPEMHYCVPFEPGKKLG